MSEFRVEVVSVTLEPHPNADSLSVVSLTSPFETTVVVRTQDWQGKDRGVYIPVDSIVPDTKTFEFLGSKKRVKAAKLRGIVSNGLLVPCSMEYNIGEDLAEKLGVTKYEAPIAIDKVTKADSTTPPPNSIVYTDIENITNDKYRDVFVEGEEVVITEKIHGANARYLYTEGQLYCGSHRQWKKDGNNVWWNNARAYSLDERLKNFENIMFCGEVFGYVQDLRYGHKPGTTSLILFDACNVVTGQYIDYYDTPNSWAREIIGSPKILYLGPWNGIDHARELAEGQSFHGDNVREGIVVKPTKERWDRRVGRVILKLHGNGFLTRKSS